MISALEHFAQMLLPQTFVAKVFAEGNGKGFLVDRGFFYVYADKIGTVQKASGDVLTEGNYLPCWTSSERNYQVLGKWPETLWKQRKISNSVYERYLYLSRDGVVSRHRNLTLCREQEQRLEAEAAVQERIKRIRGNPELFQPLLRYLQRGAGSSNSKKMLFDIQSSLSWDLPEKAKLSGPKACSSTLLN